MNITNNLQFTQISNYLPKLLNIQVLFDLAWVVEGNLKTN